MTHFLHRRHLHTICKRWDVQRSWEKSWAEEPTEQSLIGFSAHFIASIRFNRGVNVVTHKDYEGVAVKPDVEVPANEALLTAHILAMRGILVRREKRNWRS